ncbi:MULTISPECIES: Y-family DNA polymerase [Enterococcus]|uniref:Putative UV-damage repair protein UvrX n=2 Tax=Enterococcus faecalis TaxID=1351 RepID=A0A891XJP7_ENTFL|nr:Y-family DNA polymerase [Enterococcus faecalis]QBA99752.1 Y-family DNA polymerase [Enterococcaceae bacterium]EJZ8477600.1 Y-family DNA polymerase [Enterococcus faecalis]EKO5941784.1 Y-family DNA polymerase [Enterococcus faecalis]MCD4934300.1 Y-family DNA polymerase [Enterococcus faecalis]MCD4979973.1 Y-family DNA polymerase [Enterococcus faecalis]
MKFDYSKEPRRDVLCIDVKSFYASVECVERGLDPLKTMLIVMSGADNAGGLVLAASPLAKKVLGISNVTRKDEVPDHPELLIVPPRMNLYMKRNSEINNLLKRFVADEDHSVFSVDESFIDITASLKYFNCDTAYRLAKIIQRVIYNHMGLYVTIGIGDNPLLAKLALDNEGKNTPGFVAEWRYEDVQEKVWAISPITEFCGIGKRMAARLKMSGIESIYDLAHADPYILKQRFGVMGLQLYAHSWGIDRSFLGEKRQVAKEKSFGNSQVLPRDYARRDQIELVLKELSDQVATRLRNANCQTECVSIFIGYSKGQVDQRGRTGWRKQLKIACSNNTKVLTEHVLKLFRDNYVPGMDIRNLGVSFGKLVWDTTLQLDIFSPPEEQIINNQLDFLIDKIRQKFGFKALIHASSLLEGATAVNRAGLVGGHAGGNTGLGG